jgi:kumamolisin
LTLSFPLVQRGANQLSALLTAIDDPHSPQYHHYLTAAQYSAAYGISAAQRAQAADAIQALGLSVTPTSTGSDLIQATGTVARIQEAFGIKLFNYRAADGTLYVAADSAPVLPVALSALVTGVIGLDTRPAVKIHVPQRAATGADGGLDPSALRKVYDVQPLTDKGLDGTGETIALSEIDQYQQSDVATYDSAFAISAPSPQVIEVTHTKTSSPEPVLDIEILNAIAPKAQLLVYESGDTFQDLAANFDRIVTDNKAQIVSISLGACEAGLSPSDQGFVNAITTDFQRADAQGMTVLVASGDSGAYGCQDNNLSVDLPSASPFVTAVGGTALFPNSDGSYAREDGWEGPLEADGGGGGVSTLYQQPAWQTGPSVANQYSNGARQVPDVSADADPLTGYRIYYSDGSCSGNDCWGVMGGTSAATPFWAGLIALANQEGKTRLGFVNPKLYAIGAASEQGGPAAFHDVTGGGNLYYQATAGWDYSTGWGSPDAAILVTALLAS